MSKFTIICDSWKPLEKKTLKGFAGLTVTELALKIFDVAIHQKGASAWAALPARPWVKGTQVVTDDTGKIQYSPVLEFSNKDTRDAFSSAAVRAVRDRYPAALSPEDER